MDGVMVRLAVWTTLAAVMLLLSAVGLVKDHRRFKLANEPHSGAWWVHAARYGFAWLSVVTWIVVLVQGVLGFLPELQPYRSWVMLLLVVSLATQQGWYQWSWGKVERRAGGE